MMTCKKCQGRIWFNGKFGSEYELECLLCGKLIWVKLNNPFGQWLRKHVEPDRTEVVKGWIEWLKQGRLRIIKETPSISSSTTD